VRDFYEILKVHKVLRPLRKSKSAINGLSPSVKFPSSTSSFWPYQGIENFFHSPPVLDEMNNVLREKKINTNEVECVDFEENLQNANPPKNTMENVKVVIFNIFLIRKKIIFEF
jgi:hypothetical protein